MHNNMFLSTLNRLLFSAGLIMPCFSPVYGCPAKRFGLMNKLWLVVRVFRTYSSDHRICYRSIHVRNEHVAVDLWIDLHANMCFSISSHTLIIPICRQRYARVLSCYYVSQWYFPLNRGNLLGRRGAFSHENRFRQR